MSLFKEFSNHIKYVLDDMNPFPDISGNKTIVVAKAVCLPARHPITEICKQYGIKILGYSEKNETIKLAGYGEVPHLQLSKITVSAKQAVWCEYLLLRSKKFFLYSQPLNARNKEWAEKHSAMPESWNGKPLIEKTCDSAKLLKRKKNEKIKAT